MEENIKRYYPLGKKTLAMLVLRRSFFVIFMLIFLFVGLFYLQYVSSEYTNLALYLFFGYFVILLFFSLISFFLGWLEYTRYEIVLGDKNLKMQRGLIAVEQVGIPYRYIQDIKIERSLIAQIIGVSDVMVTISGSEQQEIHPGEKHPSDIHKIILPALEEKIAKQIQEIILNRAQVQQFDVSGKM
ncbi:MAG: hypothetical protein FJZ43_01645 [Candidatus Staskawiczbacteria bacterium]|nr:hypothetical protein [Candidatus Staskawiczbacteria bacterium]